MASANVVFMFPGQGTYSRGLLARINDGLPAAADVLAAVEAVGREELGVDLPQLYTDDGADVQDLVDRSPELLQMAIYAAAVATSHAVRKAGITPALHIGHSLGEIAALAAAGACSVEDGARVVARRVRALSVLTADRGAMLAVTADPAWAERLVDLVGADGLALAGRNDDRQVVLSGPTPAVDTAAHVCRAVRVGALRLASPYGFHSPVVAAAAGQFAASLGDIDWEAPSTPVYSPILRRSYQAGDDFPSLLATHLTAPFDFPDAVLHARANGAEVFLECGGRRVLTDFVRRILAADTGWTAIATDEAIKQGMQIDDIARTVGDVDDGFRNGVRKLLDVEPTSAAFDRFWAIDGREIVRSVRDRFTQFLVEQSVDGGTPAANPAPPAGPAAEDARGPVTASRDEVQAALASLYGEALEYPTEVFTEDVHLEADLGVDSVKQTDLLTRVAKQYALPPPPNGFDISKYQHFGSVVDLVTDPATTSA